MGSMDTSPDEVRKAKSFLLSTMATLVRDEKPLGPTANLKLLDPSDALVMVLNEEVTTPSDRKAKGAIVLPADTLLRILRIGVQSQLAESQKVFVSDGQQMGHVITVSAFDPRRQKYLYLDTNGRQSPLQAGNNRAGAAAELTPTILQETS